MRNRFTVVDLFDLLDLLDLLGRWTEDDRDAVLATAEDAVAVTVAEKATCLGSGMLAAAAVGLHPSIRAAATYDELYCSTGSSIPGSRTSSPN